MRIVVDTNVLVGAIINAEGANRRVLRRCLLGADTPLLGNALFAEMRDVLGREALFTRSAISPAERITLFEALCAVAEWTPTYFLWRPNLRDEADNHLIELAVAGAAEVIVSWNVRDLASGELQFPPLRVLNPSDYLTLAEKTGE